MLSAAIRAQGHEITRADSIAEDRFHMRDPFGNRLEFIAAKAGVTE